MPDKTASFNPARLGIELVGWNASGHAVEDHLEKLRQQVIRDFSSLSGRFGKVDEHGNVTIDMTALYHEANEYARDYLDYFDKYMCLTASHVYADGKYQYKSFECMQAAFAILALGLGSEPNFNVEQLVAQAWQGILSNF